MVEHLITKEHMIGYFDGCLAENDPALIVAALGDIARARGMSQVAIDTGLSRTNLYIALSGDRDPKFSTIIKVVQALGLTLHSGNKETVV